MHVRMLVPMFLLLIMLPLGSAYQISYTTWGGDEYDSAVAVFPMKDYTILVTSTGSFSSERGIGLVYLGDDGSRYARVIYGDTSIRARDAVLHDGYIYVVGDMGETAFSKGDAFLAKISLDGDVVYFKSIGRTFNDRINAIGIAGDYIYVGGYTYPEGSVKRAFVAKFDLEGNLLWAEAFGTPKLQTKTLAVSDAVYLGCSDGEDIYLVKFDKLGNFYFAERWENPGRDDIEYITSKDGYLYASGSIENIAFGNAFLMKLDKNLNVLWAETFGLGFGDSIEQILFNGSKIVAVGKWGNYDTKFFNTFITTFDEKELDWIGTFASSETSFPVKAVLKDDTIYIAGYSDSASVEFSIPNFSEVTRKTLAEPLDVSLTPVARVDMRPVSISFSIKPLRVYTKEVRGTLGQPTKGDAMLIKFAEEKPSTGVTTTTTAPTTTTQIMTTQTTTTLSTTSSSTTSSTKATSSPTSTTTQSKETIVVTTTVYTSSKENTTSEAKGGVCGVGFILGLSIIPLLIRRKG